MLRPTRFAPPVTSATCPSNAFPAIASVLLLIAACRVGDTLALCARRRNGENVWWARTAAMALYPLAEILCCKWSKLENSSCVFWRRLECFLSFVLSALGRIPLVVHRPLEMGAHSGKLVVTTGSFWRAIRAL